MAYQLSVDQTSDAAVPPGCATEFMMNPPQPSSLNYCCRPNTELYGTAPYYGGKGAPGDLVDVADKLRPQSTTRFGKLLVNTYDRNFHPLQHMTCSLPQRVHVADPRTTRGDLQNALFSQRYCKQ
jgi:hypothetical protein